MASFRPKKYIKETRSRSKLDIHSSESKPQISETMRDITTPSHANTEDHYKFTTPDRESLQYHNYNMNGPSSKARFEKVVKRIDEAAEYQGYQKKKGRKVYWD